MGDGAEDLGAGGAAGLHFLVGLHHLVVADLALADVEEVEEVGDGLGVVGAGAAADDQRTVLASFRGQEGDPGQVQDLEDVAVGQLIPQGDAQEIKTLHGILGLQAEEGDFLLLHDLVEVGPRRKNPLTPGVGAAVQLFVYDLDAEIGHADLIDVREADGEADVHGGGVLHDGVDFISNVAGGLLHHVEDPVRQHAFSHLIPLRPAARGRRAWVLVVIESSEAGASGR